MSSSLYHYYIIVFTLKFFHITKFLNNSSPNLLTNGVIIFNCTDTNSDPLSWYYDEEDSNDSDLLIVPMASEENASKVLIPNRKNGGDKYPCSECGRCYKLKSSLFNHRKYECNKEPQFSVSCFFILFCM